MSKFSPEQLFFNEISSQGWAGKMLFKRLVWAGKMLSGYQEHHKFPKWHWGKVPKYVGPGCSSPASPVKKEICQVMLVDINKTEFTDVETLLFILLVLLFKCK